MAKRIPVEQTFALSRALHQLAAGLGDYRYENWDKLTAGKRQDLENMEWTILNAASDLNSKSVMMKVDLLEQDLKNLARVTRKIRAVSKKINSVKQGINIAAKAIAFSGAIATGDVGITMIAGRELITEISAT